MHAIERATGVIPRIAYTPFMGFAMVKYAGTGLSGSSFGIASVFSSPASAASGNDLDGTAGEHRITVATGSGAQIASNGLPDGEGRRNSGFYAWAKFKIPTTVDQASLVERGWRVGLHANSPSTQVETDPAGSFMEIRYAQGLGDAAWMLRTDDGTTVSEMSTGVVPALDTLYYMELWTPGNGGNVFARINGIASEKSTNLPSVAVDHSYYAVHRIESGAGEVRTRRYEYGILSF